MSERTITIMQLAAIFMGIGGFFVAMGWAILLGDAIRKYLEMRP